MKKVIRLNKINTPQYFVDAFEQLEKAAQKNGITCQLNVDTSEKLVLYCHGDYPGVVLVDKATSSEQYMCPRCGKLLTPSHTFRYTFECNNCCEDFYRFEVDTSCVSDIGITS